MEDKNHYTRLTEKYLGEVVLDTEVIACCDVKCSKSIHLAYIDKFYNEIVGALKKAGKYFSCIHRKKKSDMQIAGWNTYCKEAHGTARDAFLYWRSIGSPRSGHVYDQMNISRRYFKWTLRKCVKEKDKAFADSLANKYLTKDTKAFWKEIKTHSNGKIKTQTDSIAGVTGCLEICSMWRDHYSALLNSSKDTSKKSAVLETLDVITTYDNIDVSSDDVMTAIRKLKLGKAVGMDGLSSEHVRLAHSLVNDLLAIAFRLMLSHGFLPLKLMDTMIISLLKDKKGSSTDINNYRPIAITCVLSKVLELLILEKCSEYLITSCHQFGFSNRCSTDNCIFALKEIINYYNTAGTPVYACMIDSSKAFDRVNHFHLFKKLLEHGMPKLVVRILKVWYGAQLLYVNWDGALSQPFHVTNGVRQGGVLSPKLFNIFLEELSVRLIKKGIGCYINDQCFNHICYADDMIIIAPSPVALQELLYVCEGYANEFEMLYNYKKTVCMKFLPKLFNYLVNPVIYLDGRELRWVDECNYLGVIICGNKCDNADIYRQIRSTYTQGNTIISKFKKCSKNVKAELFKTFCCNLYGAHLWCSHTAALIHRMKVAYNNVFRKLMGIKLGDSISQEYVRYNVCGFDALMRKSMFSMYQRTITSDNALVCSIVSSSYFNDNSTIFAKWKKILLTQSS